MGERLKQAQALDAQASVTRSLAEAQALHAEADRLRRIARPGFFASRSSQPLIRN